MCLCLCRTPSPSPTSVQQLAYSNVVFLTTRNEVSIFQYIFCLQASMGRGTTYEWSWGESVDVVWHKTAEAEKRLKQELP